jgi:hypothetical protein
MFKLGHLGHTPTIRGCFAPPIKHPASYLQPLSSNKQPLMPPNRTAMAWVPQSLLDLSWVTGAPHTSLTLDRDHSSLTLSSPS